MKKTNRTTTKKRSQRRPIPKVTLGRNDEKETVQLWTPAENFVYPRRVNVQQGRFVVEVEETQIEKGNYVLWVGAGNGKKQPTFDIMGEDMTPAELDIFIELLTIARDRARELGMPSPYRSAVRRIA
jgi:hypothetical protein